MTAIYKRELKSYFQSMTGYVLIAFLVIFTGIYFMAYNLNSGYPYFSYVLMNINYVLIIIIPMLTMRSFAEERKNKTDQLLLAAPVKLFDIVMGNHCGSNNLWRFASDLSLGRTDRFPPDISYKRHDRYCGIRYHCGADHLPDDGKLDDRRNYRSDRSCCGCDRKLCKIFII